MKLQVVVIDLELSPRNKKLMSRTGGALAAMLGGLGIAYGGLPTVWKSGDTLTADALNSNFSYLATQVTSVQSKVAATSISAAAVIAPPMGSAGPSVALQTPLFIESVAHPAVGQFSITFASGIFYNNSPICSVIVATDSNEVAVGTAGPGDSAGTESFFITVNGTPADQYFNLTCVGAPP